MCRSDCFGGKSITVLQMQEKASIFFKNKQNILVQTKFKVKSVNVTHRKMKVLFTNQIYQIGTLPS